MNARLQMNIYIEPSPQISMYADAPSALFPVMWFHHSMKMPTLGAFMLGILVNLKAIFIFLGILLCLIGILTYVYFVFGCRRKQKIISDINRYQLSKEMKPLKEKHGNG
ncbi:hypothetical protein WA026_016015 [Henosepilachna vigintioctopunctata]|uniref:Uncharacterized protein n=1 Tax=Henosepilachna vigintioctopunctata TaxID=420089 RepID=A0AAW1U3D1_9CUCU